MEQGGRVEDPELARVVAITTSSEAEAWIEGQIALYQAGKDHRCGYGSKHLESGILRRLNDEALERLVRTVGELAWKGPVAPHAPTLDALRRFLQAEAHARNWEREKRAESERDMAEVARQRESLPERIRALDSYIDEQRKRAYDRRAAEVELERREEERRRLMREGIEAEQRENAEKAGRRRS